MVSPLYVAVCLLCALGAAVFAVSFPQSWYTRAAVVIGFIASVLWTRRAGILPPAAIATLTALAAGLILAERSLPLFSALCSGTLGGMLAAELQLQMVPEAVAWILSAAILLATLILVSVSENFAPAGMREEALLGIAVLGVLIAAIPGVTAGWQSALALNISERASASVPIPMWAVVSAGISCAAGATWATFRSSGFGARARRPR